MESRVRHVSSCFLSLMVAILLPCVAGAGDSGPATWAPYRFSGPPDQPFALHFDGSQCAQAPVTPLLDLGQSFTMEAWVYLEGTGGATFTIMGKRHDWTGDPFVAVTLDVWGGSVRSMVSTGAPGSLKTVYTPAPLPGWTHIAVTQDDKLSRLYQNGVEAGYPVFNPPHPEARPEPFGVGGNITPSGNLAGYGWVGRLRQVRVWSRALAPEEIRANASRTLTGAEAGLLAYWPLDDGQGQTARDLGPNHLPLTLGSSLQPDNLDPAWMPSASPCHLACSTTVAASADATSPMPFVAQASASGCSGTPSYAWAFGDGQTSAERSPTHAYEQPGSYSWSLTAIADDRSCMSSGTITIGTPCGGLCSGTVPASGAVGAPVVFSGSASFCSGSATYAWTFGDGQTSGEPNPTHVYAAAGSYPWTLTVSAGSASCSKQGTVVIGTALAPPPQEWALNFNGPQGYLAPDSPLFDLGASFTVETWIFPEAARPSSFIMGRSHDPVNDPFLSYGLIFGDPWRLGFAQSTGNPGSKVAAMAPGPIPLRAWTHVAGVRDGSTLRLYVNGEQVATAASPGPVESSDVPFTLGNLAWPDGSGTVYRQTIGSALRQARVWSRALSADEIRANASRYLTGAEPGLVAYWPLDDGAWSEGARDLGPNLLRLTWAKNSPGPSFTHVSSLETGPYFSFVPSPDPPPPYYVVMDFDHDGRPDVVGLVPATAGAMTINAFRNDGTGRFVDATAEVVDPGVTPVPEYHVVNHALVGDLDGDGLQDLFLPDYGLDGPPFDPGQSRLLLGTAGGRLVEATATSLPQILTRTYTAAIGDLRSLGRQDIFMGNNIYAGSLTAPRPTFYLNDGGGHFTADSSRLPVVLDGVGSTFFLDARKSGSADLFLTSPQPMNEWTSLLDTHGKRLLLNDGAGQLSPTPPWVIPPQQTVDSEWPEQGSSADVDGDGFPDIMIDAIWNSLDPKHQWRLLLNNHDGTFRDASDRLPQDPKLALATYPEVSLGGLEARFADFNGDGLTDVVLSFQGRQDVSVIRPRLYLNTGRGQLVDASELLQFDETLSAVPVIPADVDGDRLVDLVLNGPFGVVRQLKPFVVPAEWKRNFTIDPSVSHRYLQAGESTTFDAILMPLGGYDQPVSLSTMVKPAHPGIRTSLAQDSAATDSRTAVSIATTGDLPPGTYWVTVTAAAGTFVHQAAIPVIVGALSCSATVTPVSDTDPWSFAFAATGAVTEPGHPAIAWEWDFGDGSAHSARQSTSHTYTAAGSHTWTLTTTAGELRCSASATVTVPIPCELSCTACSSTSIGAAPLALTFTSGGTRRFCGTASPTYAWDFGDGATSSAPSPAHTFSTGGDFNWTLHVGAGGQTCTAQGQVAVLAPPAQAWALKFDGGQLAEELSRSPLFNLGTTYTVEAWVYLEDDSGCGTVLGKRHDGTGDFLAYTLDVCGSPRFLQSTGQPGSLREARAPRPMPLRSWSHLAGVQDGTTIRLYVNGEEVSSAAAPGAPEVWAAPFAIGAGAWLDGGLFGYPLTGRLRGVRVWGRALTASEIRASAASTLVGNEPGLLAGWPLDDGHGQIARDAGPNHLDLTLGRSGGAELEDPQWIAAGASGTAPASGSLAVADTIIPGALTTGGCGTCALTCGATVPPSGVERSAAAFTGAVTPSNCLGAIAYDWDFGDGSARGTQQNVAHAYAVPGGYTWRLTASADGVSCSQTGSIAIAPTPRRNLRRSYR